MTFIIITLCVALISGIITTFMNETMLNGLYDIVFHGDITMAQSTGANFFTTVTGIAFTFAMSLMVLKFLKKGFDIYVLWTDGDPDADPMLLLINFVRAVATALIFRWVYDIFVDACSVVTNTILTSIGAETNYNATLVTGLSSLGVVPVIACLIFFIFYLILLFQFIARGVEMQVMLCGVPLACLGLLENDKGIFRSYIMQFVKAFITTVSQVMLMKIGLALLLSTDIINMANIPWGIACMLAATSMPKILREFFVPTGGGGSITNTVFQTVRVAQMAKGAFSS